MMKREIKKIMGVLCLCLPLLFSGCANNHTTGNPGGAIFGAAAGVGLVGLLGGTKPLMAVAGIGGGMLGYYVTTLRFDSGGIIQSGGQVYQIGDYVGIYIPTDHLFEPNTADFLPQANGILNSAAAILKRNPQNSILISGNTSGFGRSRREMALSEARAKQVAAFFWKLGINQFEENGKAARQLTYVGYGDYFPIAKSSSNNAIRENSHIQITSYPPAATFRLNNSHAKVHYYGHFKDRIDYSEITKQCDRYNLKGECI